MHPQLPFLVHAPPVSHCRVTVTLCNLDNRRSLRPALSSQSAPNTSNRVFAPTARSSVLPTAKQTQKPPEVSMSQPIRLRQCFALIQTHQLTLWGSSTSSASQPLVSFNVDRRSF